jgi:RHS repeat-associated protein
MSYPSGDGLICTGGTDATEQHFTGKDRDVESGLDYFYARYYSSNLGRFMTPDFEDIDDGGPRPIPYADLGNPQSFNLYSYVGNNSIMETDADGHCGIGNTEANAECNAAAEQAATQGQSPPFIAAPTSMYNSGEMEAGEARYEAQIAGVSEEDIKHADIVVRCADDWFCRVIQGREWVANPYHQVFWGDDDAYLQVLSRSISGQAGWIGKPSGVAMFYGASFSQAALDVAAADIAEVEAGDYFGTRFRGNQPLLNKHDSLRIGWSKTPNRYVFRIGGDWIKAIKSNPHINLWPPTWWFK